MAGAADFFPPFSFCAAIISDLFPLGLFFLQSLQLLLFLGSFLPPLMDVLLE